MAKHGATGAHWECSEKLRSVVFARETHNSDTTPKLARASGGFLVHWVIPSLGRSLCGHKPQDTARLMRTRGRWLYLQSKPQHMKMCVKCETKNART